MSKYIIEIEDMPVLRYDEHGAPATVKLFKAKNFNSLVFDRNGLDKLEKFEEVEKAAYNRGYKQAENEYHRMRYFRRGDVIVNRTEKAKALITDVTNNYLEIVLLTHCSLGFVGKKCMISLIEEWFTTGTNIGLD